MLPSKPVRESDRQIGVGHEQFLYDVHRVDFAHDVPAPLLMNSLIPDTRNVILLEKPSPSRNINSTAV